MPLFWLVRTINKKPSVFIVEAEGGEIALLKAGIAGFEGGPRPELLELDAKTARKIPKRLIGRVLDQFEANALLKKIGK